VTTRALEDLRREIDGIDDQIDDLITRRAELLTDIAAAKGPSARGNGGFLRPAREAALLRRLVARHRGAFPKAALVRLWREIISAMLTVQGSFSVAVFAPDDAPGYWDLARDHYGGSTQFLPRASVERVIATLGDGAATVAILPAIRDEEKDPWWPLLAEDEGRKRYVMIRLPLAPSANARGDGLEALVVGFAAPEASARDRSLFVFETKDELSRSALTAALQEAGLEPCSYAGWRDTSATRLLTLVELEGFVEAGDARIARVVGTTKNRIERAYHIGGYAQPLDARELASSTEPRTRETVGDRR
jgi:chorismate mutase